MSSGCSWSLVMASESIVETVRENKEPALWRGLECFIRRWIGRINRDSWVGTRSNVGRWTVDGGTSNRWILGNVGSFFSWHAKVGFFFFSLMMMVYGLLGSLLVRFVTNRRV